MSIGPRVCMITMWLPGIFGSQKRVLAPRKLELQIFLVTMQALGTELGSSARGAGALNS